MNKTIIININGTVFHIEEDAYEILKGYMTGVKRHFMNSADSLEITTDIENRIAEMFADTLVRDSKQALVEQDVKAVIEQMGNVEDFENADEEDKTPGSTANAYDNHTARKLFRDPDDHLLGGICSGIANYFDFNAVWVRLAFALFTMFFGTGLILYIILWIVIPKAVSRADRMAMKGEKLNLQGFKKNFEEEMTSVQNNLRGINHEARPFIYKSRDFVSDFFHYFGVFLKGSGKVLVKILGVVILLTAIGWLVFLIIIAIGFLVYGNNTILNVFPFSIANYQITTIFLICGLLMLAIPLLTIILLTISALFKNQPFSRSTGFTLLAIWAVALCTVIYYTAKVAADFRVSASFRKNVSIAPSSVGTYYLKLNDIKYLTGQDSVRLRVKERFNGMIIIDDEDNNFDEPGSSILIDIEKSDVAAPILIESFSARGPNYENALTYARNTTYQFVQQDSVLKFSKTLERQSDKLWRNQELHLTLKLPLNTKLVIDENLDPYLNGISIHDCMENNQHQDGTHAPFIMTADGLQCKVDTQLVVPVLKKDTLIYKKDTLITTKP
ncbi:MAG: PspC domain-containing protein [Mucilaginibacter sp.]